MTTDRLSHLDGWRGLAILLVLIGHAAPGASALGQLSTLGVDCFFALSGRLMAELLIVRQQPITAFLARRVARIYPALIAYVLLMLVLVELINFLSGRNEQIFISAFSALFLIHNYIPAAAVNISMEHTWSLAVEEHSYLALAFCATFMTRNRRAFMWMSLAIALLTFLNCALLQQHMNALNQSIMRRTDVRAGSIFVSVAAYLCTIRHHNVIGGRVEAFIAPICAALALIPYAMPDLNWGISLGLSSSLLAVAVATLDTAHRWFQNLLKSKVLTWLGTLSYSLYLWQQPFLMAARESPVAAAPWLALGATFIMALWSFHRIERPARAYLNTKLVRPITIAATQ